MTQPSRQEPPYTRDYEDQLVRAARTGTESEQVEALHILCLLHRRMWITRLAAEVATRAGLEEAAAKDLEQEAIIRFIVVVRVGYDPDKALGPDPGLAKYGFTVLKRFLIRIAGRPPSETERRKGKEIRTLYRQLEQELEAPPAPETIAERLGIRVESVEKVLFGRRGFSEPLEDHPEGDELQPYGATEEAVTMHGIVTPQDSEHEDLADTWEAIHRCLHDPVAANKWIVLLVLRGTPLPGGRKERPWKTIAAELRDPMAAIGEPAKGAPPLWPDLHKTWLLDHVATFIPEYPIPSEWPGVSAQFTSPRHPVPALTAEMLRAWHSAQRKSYIACYPGRILV